MTQSSDLNKTESYFQKTGTPSYSEFIHLSRYSKWLEWLTGDKRRENWEETVERYISFFVESYPHLEDEIRETKEYILNFQTMPSMRALMTAGPALRKDAVAGYNCSYLVIDTPRAFDEIMYILMCGVGVGLSVERQYVTKLPEVAEDFHESDTVIMVRDSRIGWSSAFRELIGLLYAGQVPQWDTSRVRKKNSRLKTFGGRASGPEPLEELFRFTVSLFKQAAGRKLSSIECHDLACKVADIVIVGGVRRSALLSLSNLSDDRMRKAKSGQWWVTDPQRRLANNSTAYTERPDLEAFLEEWSSLYDSKSGERGIFNRVAALKQVAKNGRRDTNFQFGCNPCSEILMRPDQFCNLSEIVIRAEDTIEQIMDKARIATILGTLQATVSKFRYLRTAWKRNTEEERLLGVSLTGIMDHPILNDASNPELPGILENLKQVVIDTNKAWAAKLGIAESTATTCVKPSGTVSQLVNSASGIHARFSPFYLRRVRIDVGDPISDFMIAKGIPHEVDKRNASTMVFSFPIKSPEGSVSASEESAIDQLERWKIYQDHWCEHKPSCTVYYDDDEFLEVGAWVWKHFDDISGISFLPKQDHVYVQAPYEEISEEKYEELKAAMPKVNWRDLEEYETEDTTTSSHTLACSGNICEAVDLVPAE